MAGLPRASPTGQPSVKSRSSRRDTSQPENHQDEAASLDSKLKATWDAKMGTAKKQPFFYRDTAALLLSWDESVDDLNTAEEVSRLETFWEKTFHFKTSRGKLHQKPRPTAQAQVNKHLANFVEEHDDPNTLLIVYYAGHGTPPDSKEDRIKLTGRKELKRRADNRFHEVVWGSAEHIIKDTQSDVLVIFDCCHAGELEKIHRSGTRRAFEYLAATSAKSTTMTAGPKSFTTALMWSMKHLLETNESFTTQELLSTIMNQAPNFPDDQCPRLSEGGPSCIRRICLAPFNRNEDGSNSSPEPEPPEEEAATMDLSLRFVFNEQITEDMVTLLAGEITTLIGSGHFAATTVLWEGLNILRPTTGQVAAANYFAHRWLKSHNKKRGLGPSPTSPTSHADVFGEPSSLDRDSGSDIGTETHLLSHERQKAKNPVVRGGESVTQRCPWLNPFKKFGRRVG